MIPLTVIGGFLGAGKTTLLNQILSGKTRRRYAVLVNDFGDLAIDGDLVTAHDGDTITFANGCVCCTMGDDFVATVMNLLQRPVLPDHILIEASGVGDPRVIAEVAKLHPQLFRDMVVVLVDAQTIKDRAADSRLADTVELQLQSADLLVLNKCDLVSDKERDSVKGWLEGRAPDIPVVFSQDVQFSLELLFLDPKEGRPSASCSKHVKDSKHHHAHVFDSVTLTMDRPVNLDRFRKFLADLPASVLRAKGFVTTDESPGRFFLVQFAGRHIDIAEQKDPVDVKNASSAMVFIGLQGMPGRDWFRSAFVAAQEGQR
tara:strand:- start:1273 stop:2220 length:948 start_codon:yes stop_codon:yes gene_type:complete